MKVKPSPHRPGRSGGVVVELGARETELPGSRLNTAITALPVFKLKRILVPVDFSDCSLKSLQYAVAFARQFSAALTLLYVVPHYTSVSDMVPLDAATIETRMRETGAKELLTLRKSIEPDVAAEAVLRVGTPHLEIVRAARDLDADLIVLSTHGRTGLSHVLMGSTTERVVRHANCPVLVLREHEHEFLNS